MSSSSLSGSMMATAILPPVERAQRVIMGPPVLGKTRHLDKHVLRRQNIKAAHTKNITTLGKTDIETRK
ncbi:uncharacterized protein FOMMEDRAFT_153577 [Fomitiporia mediterranea MF3/22]|uniref:uncharacterized protein n=1 Tax=Fomitiporia mediterranea (strain MF3/22) TaxID=694068 RepID=UPI0004407B38|nr:uncharacterized protein FOMMEDRAFT_153577 [Fomitiporia mediterranea MF3/22]EJD06178.1 hypothetical protein FOMMEDRAFT_153577 [Fomitiporia mediterranea MF3/22]